MLDEQGEIGMSLRNSKVGMSRRTLLKAGAAISVFPAPRVFAQSPEPLNIGFLTVLTGPLAAGGKQQEEGAALFLKERNGMIGSRKVELITQDTTGNPALAKTKLQELVERHRVAVSIGPLATNEAIAMNGYIRDTKVPLITTTSAATVDLKSHAVNPWVLHALARRRRLPIRWAITRPERLASRRLRSSPRISHMATKAPADFSSALRAPAARLCRSCGRRSTRRNTDRIWPRSRTTFKRSTWASQAAIPYASSSSSANSG